MPVSIVRREVSAFFILNKSSIIAGAVPCSARPTSTDSPKLWRGRRGSAMRLAQLHLALHKAFNWLRGSGSIYSRVKTHT
jgi:hypothetical protein